MPGPARAGRDPGAAAPAGHAGAEQVGAEHVVHRHAGPSGKRNSAIDSAFMVAL